MLDVLRNTTYRHLFFAQVIALLGTGLATVALGLLAFDLAGAEAGAVLGTALAIKMAAYIGVAPIASAFAERLPRRAVLVALDLIRAGVALTLPFITQIWQIYILIFVLQSASAAFTPTFQATIPDVLPDEDQYTRALSLSRLAYDMESLVSPALAALLLSVVSYHALFGGTVVGFVASAALVVSAVLPKAKMPPKRGIYERTTRGLRIYLATPRLKGLLALNLAVASASAMVIVNTVVLVQSDFGLTQTATAAALAMFGAGSMLVALLLPKLLERLPERPVMLSGAALLALGLFVGFIAAKWFAALLPLWFVLGLGYSLAQTPSGRLLRRSAHSEDRPALFAAQFALSHACWLITYPLAGWLGAKAGLTVSFLALGALAAVSVALAAYLCVGADPNLSHRAD
ncbi:MFS transporter [Acidovorax carolinensis]|uniref:MFS transporter n=1 Tax=Acidovorax carolinensis TaxID=553814 RepID=A0A240U347_9BURK|nr:MFS transporter [Acidovorax carolinensis]ART51837.1 MFS transporter [Acidovorax carolinensis]